MPLKPQLTDGQKWYSEMTARPEWQIRRGQILERDEYTCTVCFTPGGKLHVHHEYYETGKFPWDYPDSALRTLCHVCHEDATDAQGEVLRNLFRMVGQLANKKGLTAPKFPSRKEFDRDRAWEWVKLKAPERAQQSVMRFAAWLWKSGTHDNDLIEKILDDYAVRVPQLPYAYYTKSGEARSTLEARHNITVGRLENDHMKEEERQWLGGRPSSQQS